MGKRFRIVTIHFADSFAKVTIEDLSNPKDQRFLHLEEIRETEAKGVEFSADNRLLPNTMGYLLRGEKPFNQWQEGDIVEEQAYPEELDNRG